MPKTIFGTTEKSNFILNMKSTTLQKWIHGVLIFCIIFPLLGAAILCGSDKRTFISGAFLYATGFTCILFYLIVMLKKDVLFKDNKSYIAIILMSILGLVSYYIALGRISGTGYEVSTPLIGNLGRQEGYLALLSYFGIFLLATTVSSQKTVLNIMDLLVAAGFVQAGVAVLQHIPGLSFPSDYRDLPVIAYENVNLSSGLADSPIFFGSLMTLLTGIAITGAIYDKSIIRARIYSVGAVFFFLTSLFTSSIVPLIGIGAVVVVLVILQLINATNGKQRTFESKLFKTPSARLAVIIIALGITLLIVALTQGINIVDYIGVDNRRMPRDKSIAFYDSFYRLYVSGSMSPVNTQGLYEIAWSNALEIIKNNPLFGIGPDCLAIENLLIGKQFDFLDKSYNEYLYTAATRGIPALIVYLTLIGFSIKRMITGFKAFKSDNSSWFRAALPVALLAYLVQAFFSASTITVAPFFWLLLGFVWSTRLDNQAEKPKKAKK